MSYIVIKDRVMLMLNRCPDVGMGHCGLLACLGMKEFSITKLTMVAEL